MRIINFDPQLCHFLFQRYYPHVKEFVWGLTGTDFSIT